MEKSKERIKFLYVTIMNSTTPKYSLKICNENILEYETLFLKDSIMDS